MNRIVELWQTRRGLFLVLVILALVVAATSIFAPALIGIAIKWILLGTVVLVVGWFLLDVLVRQWKKRKQRSFDAKVAAKEGIEDRKEEWGNWTKTMSERGIDRYELPFYLLLGEPQSGKSVLLHNSDLHFPFGTSRLSGPGGTRGCDWWFTDEAVVLDLAGRLFTHEGGVSDEAEWEAFLEMLNDFRPLSPANGILLVLPCDSLLEDSEETTARKAGKVKDALLTLVTKLQAQLPIYVTLTKGDKIFGFAETVHRMGTEKRQEMFGWSREAEKFDEPFSIPEFREAFDGMVRRAQLLRGKTLSEARIPDALGEIDRAYAFPEELRNLRAPLETYLQRLFGESSLVDLLFFRGFYLTSGLQKGAPIAQACSALLGEESEGDKRDLESLFSRQRAYFIRDLVRDRVFGERGLVRPTSARVKRAHRISLIGYGAAAILALVGTISYGVYLFGSAKTEDYEFIHTRLDQVRDDLEEGRDSYGDVTRHLQLVHDSAELELTALGTVFQNARGELQGLYVHLFEDRLEAALVEEAAEAFAARCQTMPRNYLEFLDRTKDLVFLLGEVDLTDAEDRARLADLLGDEAPYSSSEEEEEAWGLRQVLDYYADCREGEDPTLQLPVSGYLESAVLGVTESFGSLVCGRALGGFDFGRPDGDLEEAFSTTLLLFEHEERIRNARAANEATGLSECAKVANCEAIQASYLALQAMEERSQQVDLRDFWAEQANLNNYLRFLVERGGREPAEWEQLATYVEGTLDSAGGQGIVGLRQDSGDPGGSVAEWVTRTLSKFVGRPSAMLPSKKSLEDAAKKGYGTIKVFGSLESLFDGKFLTVEAFEKKLKTCDQEVLKGNWDSPLHLGEALRRMLEEGGAASIGSEVGSLGPTYASRYPDLGALSNELHGDAVRVVPGPLGYDLKLLSHLAELRAMLGLIRNSSTLDWTAHIDGLFTGHIQLGYDTLRQWEDGRGRWADGSTITLDGGLLAALDRASRTEGGVRDAAIDVLTRYRRVCRSGLLSELEEADSSSGQGLRDALNRLEAHLKAIADARRALGQSEDDPDRLEPDSVWLNDRVQPLLEQHFVRIAEAQERHFDRAFEQVEGVIESSRASGTSPVRAAARHVPSQLGLERLREVVGQAPSLGMDPRDFKVRYPGIWAAGSVAPYLRTLSERDGLDLSPLVSSFLDSGLASALQDLADDDRRGRLTEDPAALVERLLAFEEQRAAVGGSSPFWRYAVRTAGLYSSALGVTLGERYASDFTRNILEPKEEIWGHPLLSGASSGDEELPGPPSGFMDELTELLRPGGKLAAVREPYSRDKLLEFQARMGTEDVLTLPERAARLDAYLTELRSFLYDGGEDFAPLTFTLLPLDEAGTIWESGGWFPSEGDYKDLPWRQKPAVSFEWDFAQDTELAMGWAPLAVPDRSGWRTSLVVPTALAPAILAWHYGTPASDDGTVWDLDLSRGGERILMRLTLGRPLPTRLDFRE